ncbi:MAG: hypothetical protein L0332_06865 [Chloroflexi bacterium]|nr:hypothetical protein [Chloroflexota bacterium]
MLRTFFEQVYRQQVKNPGALAAETVPATYIDVSDFERFGFMLEVGATDQAIDFKVVQATADDGTGSKDVTGAAVAQLAGGDDDNTQVLIEIETRKLDINNGFHYVACTVGLTGGTGTTGSIVFYGINPGKAPVTQPAAFTQKVFVGG